MECRALQLPRDVAELFESGCKVLDDLGWPVLPPGDGAAREV